MDYNSNLVRFFILAAVLPECLILLAILARRRYRAIPWFTIYIIVDASTAPVLFYIYQAKSHWHYFFFSWLQNTIMFTIAFMVIVELFRNLVSDFSVIKRAGITILCSTGIVLLAVVLLVGTGGAAKSNNVMKMALVMERALMLIQVGMLVAMFAFSRYTAVGWRHYQFGIGLGYGLYACLKLALVAYVAQVGATASYKTMIIEQIGYQCTVLLWTAYMLKAENAAPRPDLPSYNEALKREADALSEFHAKHEF